MRERRSLVRAVCVFLLSTIIIPAHGLADVRPTPAEAIHLVAKKRKATSAERKLAKVREDLHRNLDGKGDGFIRGWTFDSRTFTLTVDKTRYQEYAVLAATMAARSIFDLDGVPLPSRLVIRDRSGEMLGEGPFANVPKLAD
jgi:hypothetical protein